MVASAPSIDYLTQKQDSWQQIWPNSELGLRSAFRKAGKKEVETALTARI